MPTDSSSEDPQRETRRRVLDRAVRIGLGASVFSDAFLREGVALEDPHGVTPATREAIARGLRWLAGRQTADGAFGDRGAYAGNVGVAALCGTAFLCAGGVRSRWADIVTRCTGYLVSRAQPGGFIVEEEVRTHGPMYGHGFAVAYLSQVLGAEEGAGLAPGGSRVAAVLRKGVELILSAQDEQGAWRYTPFPDDSDVSVTTCQLIALLSARGAGISVPREVIDRGVGFVMSCQNPDGGFRYRVKDPPESLWPRSAAAVVALAQAGREVAAGAAGGGAAVRRGVRYLERGPRGTPLPRQAEYFYYGRFYEAQVVWREGAAAWGRWFPAVREELLVMQLGDGRWGDLQIGDEYATAMALMVLQMPENVVPMLSRGGGGAS
ncbi:prenyltransferase/squalene oxidase repeat-containing protein [Planctomyces sp. SH-PL14]|uniref:prenyltransferase/squalene oxidase repeat-containing protein n=1 Tax=Planctomyces sp. SH-PL14 TaxID=1632864 RepID=UPI00078BF2C5|nr:prenyltransferase/squalene oxidase repeat-containing protein [Planctomyces sp. SH-PL14]AMV19090.1 Prenyltransferase and squalene oxidase repeat protein [Planctomyces sp. SH-PL14]